MSARRADLPSRAALAQGGAAASIAAAFSPFRMFAGAIDEPEPAAPHNLSDKVTADLDTEAIRRVQMTKAFTALRSDINSKSPSPAKKTASPAKKAAAAKPSPGKKVGVQRKSKAIAKVKAEPMRRSRRTTGYKKGSMSEATMTQLAWSGNGSKTSPILC